MRTHHAVRNTRCHCRFVVAVDYYNFYMHISKFDGPEMQNGIPAELSGEGDELCSRKYAGEVMWDRKSDVMQR